MKTNISTRTEKFLDYATVIVIASGLAWLLGSI